MSRSQELLSLVEETDPTIQYVQMLTHGLSMNFSRRVYNAWDYITPRIRVFNEVDHPTPRMDRQQCFTNAYRTFDRRHLKYCEGWVFINGSMPVQHAWNYNENTDRAADYTAFPPNVDVTRLRYCGYIIPDAWLYKAATSDQWARNYGVMETLYRLEPEDLLEIQRAVEG